MHCYILFATHVYKIILNVLYLVIILPDLRSPFYLLFYMCKIFTKTISHLGPTTPEKHRICFEYGYSQHTLLILNTFILYNNLLMYIVMSL